MYRNYCEFILRENNLSSYSMQIVRIINCSKIMMKIKINL